MDARDEIRDLIARTALGNRAAFETLYDRTSAKLFGVTLRLLSDRGESEDVLQEVYAKIWNRADTYAASSASPMSWLIAIARNHAIDRLRARKPEHAAEDEAMEIADSAPTPEQNAIASGERKRIDMCLDRLDDEKAAAVYGAYVEGYSYQELADRYDTPLNTMRTWLRRSLIRLRECLEE